MMRVGLLVCLVLYLGDMFAQRDEHYSQYMFNSFLINPAVTNQQDMIDFNFFYRDYAPLNPVHISSQSLSVQMPFHYNSVGLGLIFRNDNQPGLNTTSILFAGNYKIKLSTGFISFGLEAGGQYLDQNNEEFTARDESDPLYQNESQWLFDIGFGLHYVSKKWYSGISLKHANEFFSDKETSLVSQYNLYYIGAYTFQVGKKWEIIPSMLAKYAEQSSIKIDFATHLRFQSNVWIGLVVTSEQELGLQAGAALNKLKIPLKIGYAYETGAKAGGLSSTTTHEVMCVLSLRKRDSFKKIEDTEYSNRPLFF